MRTIPFVSLCTEEKKRHFDGIFDDFRKVVYSSQFILGTSVSDFEQNFAKVAGTKYAVGVNSGLDALILGLRALGIGPGDEVITAPNSFVASAAAIHLVGAKLSFCDVQEDFNIDPNELKKKITSKTKAIMPVHLTGNPARMESILKIAKEHKLFIIEDAAQSIGASENGKRVGSFGDLGAFSLHPLKNLHVWGDGGMVTTNSKEIYENLVLQRNHGLKNRDEVEFFSYNSRLDSLQAVVGSHFLKLLEDTTEKRIRNARLYTQRLQGLAPRIHLPEVRDGVRHVFHVFQMRVRERDNLKSFLSEKGVETKVHYPLPIHWQKPAGEYGFKKGDFPNCDKLANEILSLPIRENLEESEISYICDQICLFYRHQNAELGGVSASI